MASAPAGRRLQVRGVAPSQQGTILKLIILLTVGVLAPTTFNNRAFVQEFSAEELTHRTIERRAVEAVNRGMSAVNYDLMLQEMLNKNPGKVNQFIYWSRPLDWHNQTLTPNPDAIYFMAFFNTRDAGFIVVEMPQAGDDGSLNANFVDVRQVPLEDAGLYGIDKGAGVKFLILPPGHSNAVPAGHTALRPATFGSLEIPAGHVIKNTNSVGVTPHKCHVCFLPGIQLLFLTNGGLATAWGNSVGSV